ncbi:MAG: TetR/AcrR family transcriptional regulator [Polyangiales bacterium]
MAGGPRRAQGDEGEGKGAERPYHHGNLRKALLDAALALLDEQGVEALSLREVARRAGVSHAAPYRHFEDKDALVAAVAEVSFDELTATMRARMAPFEEGSVESLLASGHGYVEYAVTRPSRFRVVFGPVLSGLAGTVDARRRHPALWAAGDRCYGVMLGAVTAAQARGLVREGDSRPLAHVAWSTVHGLSSLLLDGQLGIPLSDRPAIETIAATTLRMLFEGMSRASAEAAAKTSRP